MRLLSTSAPRPVPGWLEVLALAGGTVVLLIAMALAWCTAPHRRGSLLRMEGFATSSSAQPTWIALPEKDEGLRPLLDLALQREAARRGPDARVGRHVVIKAAFREQLLDPVTGAVADAATDRWHRWRVEACLYRVDDAYGTCEVLDVRAKTAWSSSTPPNAWPTTVVVERQSGTKSTSEIGL